jgi:pimeloyl-ACP methyl ester carboxylesterase
MPFLAAAGHRLEYRWIPPARPASPTLVLLHEALGSVELWRDFPDRLAARAGCGTLVYSRYGLGRSEPLAELRGLDYLDGEALVALPEVLRRVSITDPVLVGHSDGATIALIHAADGRWPVRGLVLMAPHVFVEEVTLDGIRRARSAYQAGRLRERLARYHADVDASFAGWAEVWLRPEFRKWNIEARLARIGCPVLVVQGEADPYGTAAQVEAIRRGVAGPAEVLLLPGCGHAPHLEQGERVLEAVAQFIDRRRDAGSEGSHGGARSSDRP